MIRLHFSYAGGLSSEAIRVFERGGPSHVDAILPDGTLLGARADRIGGMPPGVQIRPAGYETWKQVWLLTLACTDSQEFRFLEFLKAQVGKPYDEQAILAFPLERNWRTRDAWFCSELIAAALEASGWFPQPLSDSVNEITPRDLLLAASPWSEP